MKVGPHRTGSGLPRWLASSEMIGFRDWILWVKERERRGSALFLTRFREINVL